MRDPFAGYDAWLERPYQHMIEESDRFVDWCEEQGIDPDDPDAEQLYSDAMVDEYEYDYGDYEDDDADFEAHRDSSRD